MRLKKMDVEGRLAEARGYLASIAASPAAQGRRVSIEVGRGHPVRAIAAAAEKVRPPAEKRVVLSVSSDSVFSRFAPTMASGGMHVPHDMWLHRPTAGPVSLSAGLSWMHANCHDANLSRNRRSNGERQRSCLHPRREVPEMPRTPDAVVEALWNAFMKDFQRSGVPERLPERVRAAADAAATAGSWGELLRTPFYRASKPEVSGARIRRAL